MNECTSKYLLHFLYKGYNFDDSFDSLYIKRPFANGSTLKGAHLPPRVQTKFPTVWTTSEMEGKYIFDTVASS